MADRSFWTRREAFGGLATLLFGTEFATGPAAASESTRLDSRLTMKNGKVVVKNRRSKKYSPSDNLLNVEVHTKEQLLDFTAAVINQGIKRNNLSAFEEDGKIRVKPLVSLTEVGTECGKDELTWNTYSDKAVVDIYMDEETTESVLTKLRAGAAISAVVSIVLLASGVGSVPGFVSGLIGIALELAFQVIDIVREGCGVHIEYVKYYDPLKQGGTDVTPQ
jgi:hypothetical protein